MNEKLVGPPEPGKQQSIVSRRTLLKLLAAAGLAVSVDRLLPVSWIAPSASASEGSANAVYPGTCDGDDFPITILSSHAELVEPNTSRYRVTFDYNEIGEYLDEYAFLYANIVNGAVIYNGAHIYNEPNGGITPQVTDVMALACAVVPNGDEGPGNPGGFVGTVNGNGSFYFYLTEGASRNAAAAEDVVLNWSLVEPIGRSSPPELTTAIPSAVTLSDFIVDDPGDGVKTAAAAGAAAALGAVSLKALRRDAAEEVD